MDEVKKVQYEALRSGADYSLRLVPAIREILPELRDEPKDDTEDFKNQIFEGINYIVDIVNGTLPLINEKEVILNRDGIEEKMQQLIKAVDQKDNKAVADALEEGVLPFVEIFYQVASIMLRVYDGAEK
ncbi:MAG: hypothetical protein K6E75_11045 [Lachnospiraceae bacterium]|nr:hypothetical protein [Lachnospiraceae bacterium]